MKKLGQAAQDAGFTFAWDSVAFTVASLFSGPVGLAAELISAGLTAYAFYDLGVALNKAYNDMKTANNAYARCIDKCPIG